ncbi:hypothetical protein GHT06_012498 [Daphnia sinensis]|uniref:GPI ethanolamine phosphate transferase 1 n=1 Tax=Daphnia sinensis TaxID=1820382 RepID=A0AAD5PYZ5_9CRUS|nr:hypothetical protein GHT06_012498 [Daphnia sinensis]
MWIIFCAVCVQIVFLLSVFDIHFHSPIVKGMSPSANLIPAPAKRLVLFSADGLRFDTFLSYGNDREPNAKFLRSVASTRGKWGLSSTRVPTESRPGHVAMIAGLYEDPSAVFRGWKENPVEFDSVFNQSSYTFGWGSPDILSMFSKGTKGNVITFTYSSESEQFTGHDAYKLDEWVFEHIERFIQMAPHNATISNMLQQQQLIFFVHLLGLDTNGHTNKPHSTLYTDNLRYVDQGIAKIESLINGYFKDNKTAFIFTADHGMTDWGSHGAGHPTETQTPIVAWGAGINTDQIDPLHWENKRNDMEQADIAPLMAALLGINFPVNSVGKLPLAYLADDMLWKSHAALANTRQLTRSFQALSQRQQNQSLSWRFRPFWPLESNQVTVHNLQQIENSIRSGYFNESIQQSVELMDLCLQGMEYFYRYDEFQLKMCITLAYIGWAAILVVFLIQERTPVPKKKYAKQFGLIDQIAFGLSIFIFIVLTVEGVPFLYYAYHLLPLVLWWYCLRQSRQMLRQTVRLVRIRHFIWTVFLLGGLEFLVAGFFQRWFLSVGLIFLSLWPHWDQRSSSRWRHHEMFKSLWMFTFLILAMFPVFPPVGKHSFPILVDIGGMLLTVMAFWSSLVMHHDRDRTVLVCYTIAIPITLYVRHSVSDSLVQGQGLPILEQVLSWLLLGLPLTLPVIGPSLLWPRLIGIVITLTPSFLLLSLSYEGIFFAILVVALAVWIRLEAAIPPSDSFWTQLRRSYFFLFLTLLSFFGLGNLASLNSFDPSSVRCFVTTFSPFTMAGLLLWKITVPFIAVSSALWAVTLQHQLSMKNVYLMILLLSAAMAVQFFHWVTSRGSWLDIGTSLSHYVIVQFTVLFVMLLRSVVQFLTYGPIYFHVRPTASKYDKD